MTAADDSRPPVESAFIEGWKVDDVIEAVEYTKAGISGERWHAIERALLDLAPGAYREPGVTLEEIWPKLDDTMRRDIYNAYVADYWPKGTP